MWPAQFAFACLLCYSLFVYIRIHELPRVVVMVLVEPLPRLILYMMVYFIALMDATTGALYTASLLLLDMHVQNVIHIVQKN